MPVLTKSPGLSTGALASQEKRNRALLQTRGGAPFRPCINLRSRDEYRVMRYGVLPDGRELALGLTVHYDLSHAIDRYWELMFSRADGWWPRWLPRLRVLMPIARRFYPVKVKGYETTPLPALKGAA